MNKAHPMIITSLGTQAKSKQRHSAIESCSAAGQFLILICCVKIVTFQPERMKMNQASKSLAFLVSCWMQTVHRCLPGQYVFRLQTGVWWCLPKPHLYLSHVAFATSIK